MKLIQADCYLLLPYSTIPDMTPYSSLTQQEWPFSGLKTLEEKTIPTWGNFIEITGYPIFYKIDTNIIYKVITEQVPF